MHFSFPPNGHAIGVMVLTVFALLLFTREKIPLESSSLIILVLLAVGFEIFPFRTDGELIHAADFFHGFGHEALVAVCALMIAGQGLVRTGALEPVGRLLAGFWKINPGISLLFTLIVSACISAFINNVPVVILFLPILISVSLKTETPSSSVLMPMGFATILGGMSTTIGTSTNLLVVSVAADLGLKQIEMFDFLFPALIAGAIGVLYLWGIAPRILPGREVLLTDTSPRIFSAHLEIRESSPMKGKRLGDAIEKTHGAMKVISVERGPDNFMIPFPNVVLKQGDHLVIRDTPDRLKEFEKILKGTLYPADSEDTPIDEDHPLSAEDQQIAEIVVIEGSVLHNETLSELRFADHYGLVPLALSRPGRHMEIMRNEIGDVRLRAGDILLVQGPREQIAILKKDQNVLVLDATSDLPFTRKAPIALVTMTAIVVTAALGILPIAISASCGVLIMMLTGCLNWRDAGSALSMQVVLIVVASLALGAALLKTGSADYLAHLFVSMTGDMSPVIAVSGLMLLMAILTNVVSNNATAVIGTPVAVSIAAQMGQPPEPFVLAVIFGANMSVATPMAYKTNLLVMNAGNYTFNDFLRVGVPLVFILWATYSWLLPVLYRLN